MIWVIVRGSSAAYDGVMKVSDVMNRDVITVTPELPVRKLAALLTRKMISGAPVVDPAGNLVGVVSMADVGKTVADTRSTKKYNDYYYGHSWGYGHLAEHQLPETQTVEDIMTTLVIDISEDADLVKLADMMVNFRVHRVIVTRNKKVVGMVSNLDLVDVLRGLLKRTAAPA